MLNEMRVQGIFGICKLNGSESLDLMTRINQEKSTEDYIEIEGMINMAHFSVERIRIFEIQIIELLNELHPMFSKNGDKGWSAGNMMVTKDGFEWTELHQNVDKLICLGKAIGRVKFSRPRDQWEIYPHGIPDIVIDLSVL
jgi:hypothetical protein